MRVFGIFVHFFICDMQLSSIFDMIIKMRGVINMFSEYETDIIEKGMNNHPQSL